MKKVINFILFSLLVVLFSYSQQQTGGARNSDSPIDLIVLIDTSQNMSGHYREFIDYVSGPFLREFLRIGDTFHILSFSDTPKTELARRIEGVGDVETIIGRLHLLYPLDGNRDLNRAMDYAGDYIAALPSRPGKLVLFTAGQEAVQFSRTDTDFYPVQFPLTGPPLSSGRPPRPAPPPAQTQPPQTQPRQQPATQTPPVAPVQPPAQTQPRQQPATQTPPAAPAQPPTQTQPRQQPATQTPPVAPAQPLAQTQPRQQPAAQQQPQITETRTPVVSPDSPAENKPKRNLLQSLIDFFKGMRKQDTEKSPAESAPKGEPIKKEPAQTAPVQPPQSAAQAPSVVPPPPQPPQTAQAPPRQQPATQTPPAAPAQPSAQTQPRQQPAAQQQPQITETRTPVVSPDSPAENKPKRNLLQSLTDFFKGMRKQDTEKSPAESAPKGEPIKKEPAQTAPAQAPSAPPAQPPQTGPVQPSSGSAEKDGKFPLWILLPFILSLPLITGVVFLFFAIRRKLEGIPVRSVSYVAGRTVASPPRREATVKLDANPMVYLEVDDQNRNIGRRNTHSLKAGSTYTVGGGKSDFLIFLVPLPSSIGILRFDGKKCTFIPKKTRYFPEISGEPVPDCIEKTIRVISDSGYKLSFRFRQYEDPLIALNRTMNSTGTAGERDKKTDGFCVAHPDP